MLDRGGLGAALLEGFKFSVHVGQDGGNSGLFINWRNDKLALLKRFEMPIIARCFNAFILEMECVEPRILFGHCANDLCAIGPDEEIKVDKLDDASVVAEYDNAALRALEKFTYFIRKPDNS